MTFGKARRSQHCSISLQLYKASPLVNGPLLLQISAGPDARSRIRTGTVILPVPRESCQDGGGRPCVGISLGLCCVVLVTAMRDSLGIKGQALSLGFFNARLLL